MFSKVKKFFSDIRSDAENRGDQALRDEAAKMINIRCVGRNDKGEAKYAIVYGITPIVSLDGYDSAADLLQEIRDNYYEAHKRNSHITLL